MYPESPRSDISADDDRIPVTSRREYYPDGTTKRYNGDSQCPVTPVSPLSDNSHNPDDLGLGELEPEVKEQEDVLKRCKELQNEIKAQESCLKHLEGQIRLKQEFAEHVKSTAAIDFECDD